jgi:hypothetical protein
MGRKNGIREHAAKASPSLAQQVFHTHKRLAAEWWAGKEAWKRERRITIS